MKIFKGIFSFFFFFVKVRRFLFNKKSYTDPSIVLYSYTISFLFF